MRNLAPTLPQQSRSTGIDSAIGQIDLIGEFGEIVKSWRIRTPRCTLGSGSDCSVQLTTPGVAPLHAVLIFGKKHTLLRSVGPTLISNRHVREWLIDQPTEIAVGQSRLVIHPSIGVLATVVHAENLLDHAARMCKDPTPVIQQSTNAVTSPHTQTTEQSIGRNDSHINAAGLARLDTIERLLESLQVSLDKMQLTLGTDTKHSNESIVESVTQEIDEFGKKLFTNLNDQLSNQTGVQQSLIANLADKFTDRFLSIDEQLNHQTGSQQSLLTNLADRFTDRLGAIDEQLNRFNETSSQQTSSLKELIAQAGKEQEFIEARFSEVISHRNELIDAVQVLHSEITRAYQAPEYQNQPSPNSSDVSEAVPENTYVGEFAYGPSSVSDDQLAQSLERAQIQIQDLNAQLRDLEVERDSAQQRVALLIESWPSEQSIQDAVEDAVQDAIESDSDSENSYETPVESGEALNDEVASDEFSHPATTNEFASEEFASSENNELPAWFRQDGPEATNVEWTASPSYPVDSPVPLDSESNFASFSALDLSSYSDVGYGTASMERLEQLETSEALDQSVESSNSNLDSISDRLQRMLIDADHRRGASNPSSELRTSSSWSQRYGNQPSEGLENSQLGSVDPIAFEPESVKLVGPTYNEQYDQEVQEEDKIQVKDGSEPHFPDSLRHLYRDQPVEQLVEQLEEQPEDESNGTIDTRFESDDSGFESEDSSLDEEPLMEPIRPTPNSVRGTEKRGSDEEESIEDYMQRLLHRVRGGA